MSIVRVLVGAASRHGSTAEVAVRIAEAMRTALPGDAVVEIRPAVEVGDLAPYDAVVLGSAVYMGRWLDDARAAAQRIAARPPCPVWLFSSGPIGSPPKPDEDPAEVAALVAATSSREHRLFAGRLDRDRLGLAERATTVPGDAVAWDTTGNPGRMRQPRCTRTYRGRASAIGHPRSGCGA
jgi:menaquinone-dependent protoporphyrinogen oxidase